jgi:hypothetical protein
MSAAQIVTERGSGSCPGAIVLNENYLWCRGRLEPAMQDLLSRVAVPLLRVLTSGRGESIDRFAPRNHLVHRLQYSFRQRLRPRPDLRATGAGIRAPRRRALRHIHIWKLSQYSPRCTGRFSLGLARSWPYRRSWRATGRLSDVAVKVPAMDTGRIQELYLPFVSLPERSGGGLIPSQGQRVTTPSQIDGRR